jgi:hypothetical protein
MLMAAAIATAIGCKHEPLLPRVEENVPPDTTTDCDPSVVYFQNDVMPLFASSCALSGCHNAASAADGVVLTTYANIMNTGEVNPGNPNDSKLFESITDNNPEDRMPPPSSGITLTQDQINLINDWIAQGAQNTICVASAPCDTLAVSFAADIQPIISTHCLGCHSGSAPSGGIALSNHQQVLVTANNGKLLGSVSHAPSFSPMPQGQAKLDDCKIALIRNWIAQGAANN